MEGHKDDLKWFGEGFDGFPKRLPEDCVEYMLLIIDSSLMPKEQLNQLEMIRKESLKLAKKLLKDYIWQRDEFALEAGVHKSSGLRYLHGLTNYGDSVEDEWLIVYLLRELSRQFPKLWIKVVDTDGEFLLIEAANALPRWLNPEIADNRVWISDEKLLVIPLTASQTPSSDGQTRPVSRSLNLEEALQVISKTPEILIHSPLIEAEAFYRLKNYPDQVHDSLHYARITVPRKLAYLLHVRPALIAPAVETFYLRDPIGLMQLQKGSPDLVLPPEDLVTVSARFTKVLYAQLKSQQFSVTNAWKLLLAKAEQAAIADHAMQANLLRMEMGMKVTCGFEMLVSDSSHQDKRSVQELKILLDDLKDGTNLPTDAEMATWQDWDREDNEGWLDINFEDFEKELQGKKATEAKSANAEGTFGPALPSGFGDAKTQADLRKMVQRFEQFLNDDKAGLDGAEVDDMDIDDDDDGGDDGDDDDEGDSEDEDKAVSFDENEFARLMREMMGMPPTEATDEKQHPRNTSDDGDDDDDDDDDEDDDHKDEAQEIHAIMRQLEAELTAAGALSLDPVPVPVSIPDHAPVTAVPPPTSSRQEKDHQRGREEGVKRQQEEEEEEDDDEEEGGELNIDFNLAQNLLESFKSQAGGAGPGGNLLGLMGLPLPRDEGEVEDQREG